MDLQDSCTEYETDHEYIQEVVSLLPAVLKELQKIGQQNVVKDFFKLVCDGKFPMNNILFLLWTEVVQWFTLENSSKMIYMDQTKNFWKLGMRHFGGKFVRYMTGFKNTSDIVFEAATKGHCNPIESDINFAVPSEQVIRNFNPYNLTGTKRQSGIYNDVMDVVSKALHQTLACLTFDGKKIKQGLTENSGDINLLGFEEGMSLQQKQNVLKTELNSIESTIEVLNNLVHTEDQWQCPVSELPAITLSEFKSFLLWCLKILSSKAHNIRTIQSKKEYARKKFIESGGDDWHKSKYVYVISALNAYLYEIDSYLTKHMAILDDICYGLSVLSGSTDKYQTGDLVHFPSQSNYVELRDDQGMMEPRFIKQRSERWHSIRKEAMVTGSTIYQALGLDGLKSQRYEK